MEGNITCRMVEFQGMYNSYMSGLGFTSPPPSVTSYLGGWYGVTAAPGTKAGNPVMARPKMSACTSWVPS
jgi:hypothetical protein